MDIDDRATNPSSTGEALEQIMGNFLGNSDEADGESSSYEDPEDTEEIKAAKRNAPEPEEYSYKERDVMLYNLGIGAKAEELHWTYENADGFAVSGSFPKIHHVSHSPGPC